MKTRIFLLIFLALSLATIRSAAQTENDFLEEEITASMDEETVTEYMIVAGVSRDFRALEHFAKLLSRKTGLAYDDLGRVYQDSTLVMPENCDDELYCGTYIFRRWEFEAITIELNIDGIYFSPSEDTERPLMMIVAGMSTSKEEAIERLELIRKYVPTAYLKKKEVYMGCIH